MPPEIVRAQFRARVYSMDVPIVIETTLDRNLRRLQPADFARTHKTLVPDNTYIHDRKIL